MTLQSLQSDMFQHDSAIIMEHIPTLVCVPWCWNWHGKICWSELTIMSYIL